MFLLHIIQKKHLIFGNQKKGAKLKFIFKIEKFGMAAAKTLLVAGI